MEAAGNVTNLECWVHVWWHDQCGALLISVGRLHELSDGGRDLVCFSVICQLNLLLGNQENHLCNVFIGRLGAIAMILLNHFLQWKSQHIGKDISMNTFAPGMCQFHFNIIFKLILVTCLQYFLWSCPQVNAPGSHWWYGDIGSGKGLVKSGNRPLP